MLIRPAKKEDYNQLLGLLRQLNPTDPEITGIESRIFDEIIESQYLELFVAKDENLLLGSCYVNIIPNMTRGGRPYAVIENVIIDSAHRNLGIGKALMSSALDLAWKKKCYKVMLMSGRKDKSVHSFYKKCGFDSDEKQAYIHRAP
ncbi:MAG: GNAT family N-acetyltransferase [Gammaproteobacteria bacterium]|nr:GNAT family N-acetyltransferase [Gammaproteobacteria bacterium]